MWVLLIEPNNTQVDMILCRVTGVPFYNTSLFTFDKLRGDPDNIAANLVNYIQ